MKSEFCYNSKRWIELMAYGSPPESCPYNRENFMHCQFCGYYELKESSKYLKEKIKKLKSYKRT
jgi:hypothetical protein